MNAPAERLLQAVQDLSLARSLEQVMEIVRHAARELGGADGASFVLRDADCCFYAEEDAIGPLWKGKRFPMSSCVSGWVMKHKSSVVIEDIYLDPRVPIDAYKPTFVKSMAMVPIRAADPIGAIGNYWARRHVPTPETVQRLEALANFTSIALENVSLYRTLEQRVAERTAELELVNRELESFSYSVAHDLRAPLRAIEGFGRIVQSEKDRLSPKGRENLRFVRAAGERMGRIIDDLLTLSRVSRQTLEPSDVDLVEIARSVMGQLAQSEPRRRVSWECPAGLAVKGDPGLLRIALENLLSNAWKFTGRAPSAAIKLGAIEAPEGKAYFVKDNGAGFDMAYSSRLFNAFQRLHTQEEFPGTGVGLATVARIVQRHRGRIWAEAAPGKGAAFYFTLGPDLRAASK